MTDDHDKRAAEIAGRRGAPESSESLARIQRVAAELRATAERARADGKAEGVREERAAVVAHLRHHAKVAGDSSAKAPVYSTKEERHMAYAVALDGGADAIERGEHVASAPVASAEEKCPRCSGRGFVCSCGRAHGCEDCGGYEGRVGTGSKGGDHG